VETDHFMCYILHGLLESPERMEGNWETEGFFKVD